MTTPQLHYIVRCYNDDGLYGKCSEAGYFDKLCNAFQQLIQMTPGAKCSETLAIDAANGVGAQKLVDLRRELPDILPFQVFNDGTRGHLNEKVFSICF